MDENLKLSQRFWDRVVKTESCWLWKGYRNDSGYGMCNAAGTSQPAHRLAYQEAKGLIPDGMHIDHLCRNPACVNPDHLEAVTPAENARRGQKGALSMFRKHRSETECRWGHALDEANTYTDSTGRRRCRKCNVQNVLRNRVLRGKNFFCPFCRELAPSLEALKTHLQHDCLMYANTESAPQMAVDSANPAKPEQTTP